MCRYPHETHFMATSSQLPTFLFSSYTHGWVCSEFFLDSIALIELILSVKIKYLPSASFSIWSIAVRIAASSAVKHSLAPSYCSLSNEGRQNQPLHPSVNHQCKINLLERTLHPWREHRKAQPPAQNSSKLMSRVADFRLSIQPTDLMERYKTFLWTQTIQCFQPIAE
jgi:hypothetical protein